MQITNAIVHQITKSRGTTASTKLGKGVLSADAALEKLISGIVEFFDEGNNVFYGKFDQSFLDSSKEIATYRENNITFIKLSIDITARIKSEIEKTDWGTGGYVLIAEFTDDDSGNLAICMLDNVDGVSIDDANLIVRLTKHLEISRLKQAVRMSYSAFDEKQEDYLAFVRNTSQDMASQYFMQSFGCTEYKDAKRITTSVIDSLAKFYQDNKATLENKNSVRKALHEHIDIAYEKNRILKIDEISRVIYSVFPTKVSWQDHIKKRKLRIPDSFRPGNNYSSLRMYHARGLNYRISFSDSAFIDKELEYDEKSKTLTIRKLDQEIIKILGDRNAKG